MRRDHLSEEEVFALAEDELREPERRDAFDHIDGCAECAAAVGAQRDLREALSATLSERLDAMSAPSTMSFEPRPKSTPRWRVAAASAAVGAAITAGAFAISDAPAPAEDVPRAGAQATTPGAPGVVEEDGVIPASWTFQANQGDGCVAGTARGIAHEGEVSSYLHARDQPPAGFCTLSQFVQARDWRGQRVRFSAWARAEDIRGWAGLWMRIDGGSQESLAFDNMQSRPIQGTRDWRRYDVVLDVPTESSLVVFGALLNGQGKVWLDDVSIEPVPRDVPTTSLLGATPRNLDFESQQN